MNMYSINNILLSATIQIKSIYEYQDCIDLDLYCLAFKMYLKRPFSSILHIKKIIYQTPIRFTLPCITLYANFVNNYSDLHFN